MIALHNLHIGYSKRILSCEEIHLERGKVYILIGKNGAGKSTLLKTISKQLKPLSGQIFVDGCETQSIPTRDFPKLVSFVPVQFPHMDYVRASEYIAAGRAPYTDLLGRITDADAEEIDQAIKLLEIEALRTRFTTQLSDGEKQLVSIAKSVAQQTPIILLDEPTAFLDYANKKRVLYFLKEAAEKLNKCILLSAHDINLCLEFTEDFLVVEANKKSLKVMVNPTKDALLACAFGEEN